MPRPKRNSRVFLNLPYSQSYEKILIALTAAVVAIGRTPALTFKVPEGGQGRLRRIFGLLNSCRVSIHDLSAVGCPVRFNMPFELGLACAIRQKGGRQRHDFIILERTRHRLQRTLSDMNGFDPRIHNGCVRESIRAVLGQLKIRGRGLTQPTVSEVFRLHLYLMKVLPALKRIHASRTVFDTSLYDDMLALAWVRARDELKLFR
jgi:hypothetical protein